MEQIGPYRIVRKIGEGGMGVVYAAHDERLNRTVAIKTIRESVDDSARERFVREARAAASLNHPNVCQLFDIGECDGKPFIVMELLEGESLAARLDSGALPIPEVVRIALGMLTALESLHARGLVHRDLKPSNVFLAAHGVKLLDFGLAREAMHSVSASADAPTLQVGRDPLTLPGMIVGTPRYMAPEQLLTGHVDARSDLFAAGAIVYEMASGKPAFDADSAMKIFHAVVYEAPPNLGGSATIAALNRIIHRAMEKNADERYQSAAAMAKDLREILMISDVAAPVSARRVTRLMALPFRVLRPDAETDFLAQALPEAITSSLAGLDSVTVRSSLTASKFAGDSVDLKRVATEAEVDLILTGTLLRAGEQLRVTTQLVEVPAGTVLWSMNSNGSPSDVFEMQDRLTHRIVQSLDLPLSEREQRLLRGDLPSNPRAHESYLRAGEFSSTPDGWTAAQDLYLRALDEDSRFAPAWARLARIYLLMGKYGMDTGFYAKAEHALQRALDINPELPIAHHIYALLEVATDKAQAAMLRLLDRVQKGTNDPEVFAGLVTACRYCGLLETSAAAHEQAKQLDPTISTSAQHTYWMLGEWKKALAAVDPSRDFNADEAYIYDSMGDTARAIEILERRVRAVGRQTRPGLMSMDYVEAFLGVLLGEPANPRRILKNYMQFPDPEGRYYVARFFARIGSTSEALDCLEAAEQGFFCYPFYVRDPWLDPLRAEERFVSVMRRVEGRWRDAQRAFEQHPGSRLFGVGLRR